MAAPYNPPKKNEDCLFYVALEDYANPGNIKTTPTIAAGDFKVSKDGGALANLSTLPAEGPASSGLVLISLSNTEMNADNVVVICKDQSNPKEWADKVIAIPTTQ